MCAGELEMFLRLVAFLIGPGSGDVRSIRSKMQGKTVCSLLCFVMTTAYIDRFDALLLLEAGVFWGFID